MFFKNLRQSLFYTALLASLVFLQIQCGPGSGGPGGNNPENPNSSCVPTVIEGLELSVTELGSNVYAFEVCSTPPASYVFSVYGGVDQASVSGSFDVNLAVRSPPHLIGASAGDNFQITFKGSDNYFAIYQDSTPNGVDTLDNSTPPLVQAHLLPGH